MASITKQVWEILDNDITIKKDLERGIINVSALSQYIIGKYKIKGSIDSVISAIRRYKADETIKEDYALIKEAMHNAVITTKTNISLLTLRNTTNTYKYISKIISDEDFLSNEVFRLVKTRHDVQLVIDRDSMKKAKSLFPSSTVENIRDGLVEIGVKLTEEAWKTKGVLSRIAHELATQNINIELTFSFYPVGISLFIDESELVRAHEALMRISGR